MQYSDSSTHPDAQARSGMLAELARRWAERPAQERHEPLLPGRDDCSSLDDRPSRHHASGGAVR